MHAGGTNAVTRHEQVGTFGAAIGKFHGYVAAALVHALERVPELIAPTIACFYQKLAQPIPGRYDLQLPLFRDHFPLAIERNPLMEDDADIDGAGAALVQSLQQFEMGGEDANATADQFDR